MKSPIALFIAAGMLLAAIACSKGEQSTYDAAADGRPNFIVILADDLGITDLGAYGGEIPTPNLDHLAAQGVKFSNFYAAPGCSPARAMLMSGAPPHVAGLGGVPELLTPEQRRQPGYEGYLNFRVASLAEVMRDGGYATYMAGKWHLGSTEETSPMARGFEKSFALLGGAASHFGDQKGISSQKPKAQYRENGDLVSLPANFYSTDAYTDKIIEYISSGAETKKPFFAYLAYSAPHWPMQAPDGWLQRFRGKYDEGYQPIYSARVRRGIELGIFPDTMSETAAENLGATWSAYDDAKKRNMARRMESYAAMVSKMDAEIGRLFKYLDETGVADNTIVFFLSDNGPDFTFPEAIPQRASWVEQEFDNSTDNIGRQGSFISYGMEWAQVGAGPYHLFKGTVGDGGIRAPAIVAWPGVIDEGKIERNFATLMDVPATILDVAGLRHPSKLPGSNIEPLYGKSMKPLLDGSVNFLHSNEYAVAWEMLGTRAIRKGQWKLAFLPEPLGRGEWALYDLELDPFEKTDLAKSRPEIAAELLEEWREYEARYRIAEYPPHILETMLRARPADIRNELQE